jgi:hypothetical protein
MKPARCFAIGLLFALALIVACNRKPWIQTRDAGAALKALAGR